jgi:hypothetical protein
MPVPPALLADARLTEPLGSLLLSVVEQDQSLVLLRAAKWHRDLHQLGVRLPFFLVHDVGVLLTLAPEQRRVRPRTLEQLLPRERESWAPLMKQYLHAIEEIAASHLGVKARGLKLGDDLVVVIIARVFTCLADKEGSPAPTELSILADIEAQLPTLFGRGGRERERALLTRLDSMLLGWLTTLDTLDVDTLKLLGMLGAEAQQAGVIAQVDLLSVLATPSANDIVNFSLELLPSVLETKRSTAATTRAGEGYAGLGTRGALDALMLGEFTWDDEEFDRRALENELLYYTHEQASQETRRLHYIVVDASASMRGDRSVFARGVAIALMKRLQLEGEESWLRFFDARLYEVQRPARASLPIAHVLAFMGERGRNASRVFAQLLTELELLRTRDKRDPIVHLITHGALAIPRPIVTAIAHLAKISGVFIMPRGGALDLGYLDLLEAHSVVDYATLAQKDTRLAAGIGVVAQATARGTAPPPGGLDRGAPATIR